jgi:hypothetical protein
MANTLRFKRGLVATIPTAAAGEPLFTTDTFDLYIGNGTTNTRFQKYIASGTTSQLLRGDGSLLTMPIVLTSPSNGQVLKYNGTSWVNDSDAGITGSGTTNYLPKFTGASTLGNSIIFDNGTSVGISSASPSAGIKLQVDGAVFVNRSGNVNYVLNSASSHYGFIQNDAGNKWSLSSGTSLTSGLGTAALTWFSTGNVSIGNLSDNGLRFQVTGDGYFSGSLGLGITAPTTRLYVKANGANSTFDSETATDARLEFRRAGTRIGYLNWDSGFVSLQADSGNYLSFNSGGSEKLRLDSSGNLGLGVVPSAWFNTVRAIQIGNVGGAFVSGNTTGGGSSSIGLNAYFDNSTSNWIYGTSHAASYYQQAFGRHMWHIAPSGTAGNAITFTQAMTLTANGRLLLGTTSEGTQTLQVTGASLLTTSASGSLTAKIRNEVTSASGNTGYGLAIESEASGASSYALTIRNLAESQTYLHVSTATGIVGNVGIGLITPQAKLVVLNSSGTAIPSLGSHGGHLQLQNGTFGLLSGVTTGGNAWMQVQRTDGTATAYNLILQPTAGSVAIGSASSSSIPLYLNNASGNNTNLAFQQNSTDKWYIRNITSTDAFSFYSVVGALEAMRLTTAGAATFSSTAQAAGFITSGGAGYAVINSASNTVTAIRPTGGGTSIMSTNSNGLHIAVGTQAAGDLILASNNTERIRLSSNGFFSQLNATNPSGSITDSYIQYSADVIAGNAAPHFRTENGAIIKLYQETTAVGNSTISVGGGNAVLDDTEFGGYTLRQVVQALKNQGILA